MNSEDFIESVVLYLKARGTVAEAEEHSDLVHVVPPPGCKWTIMQIVVHDKYVEVHSGSDALRAGEKVCHLRNPHPRAIANEIIKYLLEGE